MKTIHLILNLVLIASSFSLAHAQLTKSDDVKKMAVPSQEKSATYKAVGVVKSADPAKNSVVLAHDPVKSLDWPSMTMKFMVKDKASLDKLAPGKKVEFEFIQQGKEYLVTNVK